MLGVSSLGTTGSLADPIASPARPDGVLVGADDDSGVGLRRDPDLHRGDQRQLHAGAQRGRKRHRQLLLPGGGDRRHRDATSNTYAVTSASTVVIEGAGGIGQDVVSTSVSYALSPGSEIEALQTNRDLGQDGHQSHRQRVCPDDHRQCRRQRARGQGRRRHPVRQQRQRSVRPQQCRGDLARRRQHRRDHGLCRRRPRRRHADPRLSRAGTNVVDRRLSASDHERAHPGRPRRRRQTTGSRSARSTAPAP